MNQNRLTIESFYWRATQLFPEKELVTATEAGTHQYTYSQFAERVQALAQGLSELGVSEGDRIGTFGWNHFRHFEAYFAVPLMGAQLHTINVVVPDNHIEHIISDAQDDILLVDPGEPFEKIERLWDRFENVQDVVVMGAEKPNTVLPVHTYEELIDGDDTFEWPTLREDQPASMCYTSGTTGKPKGVEYTHKMVWTHGMVQNTPSSIGIHEDDVVLHVVPMYHVNGWGFPYSFTLAGAKQVFPGRSPDTNTLATLIQEEEVTIAGGVPTVWLDMLEFIDEHDVNIDSLERLIVGGSAMPKSAMKRYKQEHDVTIDHSWGMTETMSISTVSHPKSYMSEWNPEERFDIRGKQGLLAPSLKMQLINDGETLPWDGEAVGEVCISGPMVVSEYYNRPDATANDFIDDGDRQWLKTGDVASIDERGYLELVDRDKDVIKSGGEYISSIELENTIMEHAAVLEAAVIGVDDERWRERPVACIKPHDNASVDRDEIINHLRSDFPRWWLPDDIRFVESLPKTAVGKFDKKKLRNRFSDDEFEDGSDT